MLHLNHLKKSFGKNEILTDIEYTFEEGNIYPVLGGAGAGRTTLFECIAGDTVSYTHLDVYKRQAYKSGVKYVAQPGGSVRDDQVIETANKRGMAMCFTGMRLFHH